MDTKTTLSNLGLTPSEIEVYLAMLDGKMQVKDIINVTGMKRPSVYYAINRLETRGLVGRVQAGEYNRWQLSPASALDTLIDEKQAELEDLKGQTALIAEQIEAGPSSQSRAQVTFYEGQKAVEGVVFNSLYCKGKEILSIAPDGNFFQQTGAKFATRYVAERKKRGIKSKHLWESQGPMSKNVIEIYYKDNAEIKILPESMHEAFSTTVFIYDDTVMYISSKLSAYAVVFKSKEHAELQRAVFKTLWQASKPLKKN